MVVEVTDDMAGVGYGNVVGSKNPSERLRHDTFTRSPLTDSDNGNLGWGSWLLNHCCHPAEEIIVVALRAPANVLIQVLLH